MERTTPREPVATGLRDSLPRVPQAPHLCSRSTFTRPSPASASKRRGYFWPSSFPKAPGARVTPDAVISPSRGRGNVLARGVTHRHLGRRGFGLGYLGYRCARAAAAGIIADPGAGTWGSAGAARSSLPRGKRWSQRWSRRTPHTRVHGPLCAHQTGLEAQAEEAKRGRAQGAGLALCVPRAPGNAGLPTATPLLPSHSAQP